MADTFKIVSVPARIGRPTALVDTDGKRFAFMPVLPPSRYPVNWHPSEDAK